MHSCIEYMSVGTLNLSDALCIRTCDCARTNSSLVVPLLLALHSTTRAMTLAMAAVSNTPPMTPPVAAPATAPVPAHTQPSSQGIDVHLYIMIQTIHFISITYQSLIII